MVCFRFCKIIFVHKLLKLCWITELHVFLFKWYWYDTTDRGIKVDPHYGLVEINSKARLRNVNDVFVFTKQCQQGYYTYTPSFRKDRSRVDWLSVIKMKLRGRVNVVQDENEDTSVRDEVFQVSELVETYRVAPSIDFEENSNFSVFDDSLVDIDAEELNVVLNSSGQANVDEDDDRWYSYWRLRWRWWLFN